MTGEIAILCLGARSATLAQRLRGMLPGSRIHAPACAAGAADVRFDKAAAHLRGLFEDGCTIVGLCASGILIRAVAPALGCKSREPAVVAVAEDGSAVVPSASSSASSSATWSGTAGAEHGPGRCPTA